MAEPAPPSRDDTERPLAAPGAWPRGAFDRDSLVRRDFVEALQRRAARQQGPVRRMLDARLAALREFGTPGRAPAQDAPTGADDRTEAGDRPDDARQVRSPLARLIDRLAARRGSAPGSAATASAGASSTTEAPTAATQTLALFRHTWAHLNAERRWGESLAALPGNAGPLHSQHVVHRALTLMREVSPEYLDHFVSHVEALMSLETAAKTAEADAVPAQPDKKSRANPIR